MIVAKIGHQYFEVPEWCVGKLSKMLSELHPLDSMYQGGITTFRFTESVNNSLMFGCQEYEEPLPEEGNPNG